MQERIEHTSTLASAAPRSAARSSATTAVPCNACSSFGPRLRQEFLSMCEHQHLTPRELRQVRENYGLAGPRR
ncbi:MAG: hypothetical protein WDO74_28175 [Pseudomonadota bacterium]